MRPPLTRLYIPPSSLSLPRFKLSPSQTHKLTSVLRSKEGDTLVCFNEQKGEYTCRLLSPTKGDVEVLDFLRPAPPPLTFTALAFSPLKPERTQQLIESCTQLGVSHLIPLHTDHGQKLSTRWSSIKAQEWLVGATEQCGRFAPPLLSPLTPLIDFLTAHSSSTTSGPLLVGDTQGSAGAQTIQRALQGLGTLRATFLVGPEGGWSAKELEVMRGGERRGHLKRVTLGPLILRAETAAIAALAGINNAFALQHDETKKERIE